MAAAVVSPGAGRRHDSVFLSVFPKTNFTTPTPEATPNIGTISSPVQSFGGFNASHNVTDDAVRFNRAWSAATRFLSLPPGLGGGNSPVTEQDTLQAFSFLLDSTQKDLISWYTNEINTHFRHFVLPELQGWQRLIPASEASDILGNTLNVLQDSQHHYLSRIDYLASLSQSTSLRKHVYTFGAQIKRNLHTLVLHSLPRQRVQTTLANAMFQQMETSLEEGGNPEKCRKADQCLCTLNLDGLALEQLHDIGLGGLTGERAFAHAVHRFLQGPAIGRRCFQVDWNGHSSVVPKLRSWVSRNVLPLIEQALAALSGNNALKLAQNDADQFVSMAVTNLGRLRALHLFDYVKSWPASTGAILDVWEYLNAGNQADKAHVCRSFSEQSQRRLLHAGASTSEVLSIYVNVIHSFKSLDSRGVLLEKVAVPIRNYLRARDDTVSIIAASFLADVDADGNVAATDPDKICPDITIEVSNSTLEDNRDKKMLNWDNMEWMPDPIDAGPDYKSSRSEDVVANILGLFEQEEFIKEVTTVLAQHLLDASDAEYIKETRLVELFKSRLDATKLQAAEVMLKDMRDSVALGKRINPFAVYGSTRPIPTPREIQAAIPEEGVTLSSLYRLFESRMKRPQFIAAVKLVANKRDDLFYAKRTRLPPESAGPSNRKKNGPNFKTQILSSFFWPQLRSNEFDMPSVLEPLVENFEHRFSMLGSQRKLQFRPALGKVSIRLDLNDRTVDESDVPGWRASVIDSFALDRTGMDDGPAADYDANAGLTPNQLMGALNMEEELVVDALNFWTNKNVLYRMPSGAYAVLERLDMDVDAIQPQIQQEQTISAVMSQDAMLRDSAPMFETFIANMLRNQGPKEVGGMMGITGFMKMVMPTFTYGDEEVRWLLSEMEGRGEVARNGDTWSVVQ